MRTIYYVLPTFLLLIACNQENIKDDQLVNEANGPEIKTLMNTEVADDEIEMLQQGLQPITSEVIEETKKESRNRKRKERNKRTTPTIVNKVEDSVLDRSVYRIPDAVIDSLNSIEEVFDSEQFGEVAVTYFEEMASQLGGKNFYAENAGEIMSVVKDIVDTRLSDGTDLVLLIDKTGSMDDDIESVRNGLELIKTQLRKHPKTRVAVASYGDKNWHGDLWFRMSELTTDIKKIDEFMLSYSTMGNHDTPESVNDAIAKVVLETEWTPGNNRMVLVIGDAPSQQGDLTDYSNEDVVNLCQDLGVTFNLYPVIIGASKMFLDDPNVGEIELELYPNPVVDNLNVRTGLNDYYNGQIFNLSGKMVKEFSILQGNTEAVDVSDLATGTYVVQLYNAAMNRHANKKFVKVVGK